MDHEYDHDICVVGAGRIGLPWAVLMAAHGFDVVCVDVEDAVVDGINEANPHFEEPGVTGDLQRARDADRIRATSDPEAVGRAKLVGFCLYCPRDGIAEYVSILGDYAEYLSPDQVIITRSTVPISIVDDTRDRLAQSVGVAREDLRYVVFPERTGTNDVYHDIGEHPAIVGTDNDVAQAWVDRVVARTRPRVYHLDPRSAMFVKLIDNSYRDAVFALANYYVVLADAFGLSEAGSRLVEIAEDDYKNEIFLPGPVGGKCLRKDSYFLTGEWTPDDVNLFGSVREIHDRYEDHVVETIVDREPDKVAILGTGFKPETGNERGSFGLILRDRLRAHGIDVTCFDPHADRGTSIRETIADASLTVLAMNHRYFDVHSETILEASTGDMIDLWNLLSEHDDVVRP